MSFQYDQYLERHRSNVKRGFDWLSENLPEILSKATITLTQLNAVHGSIRKGKRNGKEK